MRRRSLSLLVVIAALAAPAAASANTSHAGWPEIDGMLLMNKRDQHRPLDARPGFDPFGGEDPSYSCDGLHKNTSCLDDAEYCEDVLRDRETQVSCDAGQLLVSFERRHNELLGGHGNDEIHAGPTGDVIWGDYKPSGQPTTQHDVLIGGAGREFIYASHGYNRIHAGGGNDWLKAHWGRGIIDCGGGNDLLYVSRRAQPGYRIRNCETVSHKTLGY